MERKRIGVLGAGFMGRSYASIVHRHHMAELAGVADVSASAARLAAGESGSAIFGTAEEMIDKANLDGIIIATPEHLHRDPAVHALEAGIGVLVEKPIASTVEDAQAIIDAAASGATLMVGHVLRFDARYGAVREAVESGGIGTPLTAFARRLNGTASPRRIGGRVSLPLFLGVHDYDVLRWIVGSDVTRVVAQERHGFLRDQGFGVEDASNALLEFANGALGIVELSWVLPDGHPTGFDQRLDVTGTSGRFELTGHDGGLHYQDGARESWPDTMLWPVLRGEVIGALRRQTSHFIDCLLTGQAPLVSGRDGLIAVKVALAVEESARTGKSVAV